MTIEPSKARCNGLEEREQILELREKVARAERERINGAEAISVSEARKRLYQSY